MDHNCLLLRYPRSPEYFWVLQTEDGPQKMMVGGRFDTDDGDVLTGWALDGRGIVLRSWWDVGPALQAGALQQVLPGWQQPASVWAVTPQRLAESAKVRVAVAFLRDWLAQPGLALGS